MNGIRYSLKFNNKNERMNVLLQRYTLYKDEADTIFILKLFDKFKKNCVFVELDINLKKKIGGLNRYHIYRTSSVSKTN